MLGAAAERKQLIFLGIFNVVKILKCQRHEDEFSLGTLRTKIIKHISLASVT